MSIQPLNSLPVKKNNRVVNTENQNQNQPAFKGLGEVVVGTMDFIDKGGYAASFIIQDGIGFIAPRVGKGLLRGSKQVDENGNPILDENGKQKREYNWKLARKEFLREIITGPSAFLIPIGMLAGINKYFGRGNNVKLDYIDGLEKPFTEFVQNNVAAIRSDNLNDAKAVKSAFYEAGFKDVITRSINDHLPESEKLSDSEIESLAKDYTQKQLQIESINSNKSLNKKEKANQIAKLGTVEDDYMLLRKGKVGGSVDELAVNYTASNGKIKSGVIGEFLTAMNDYFDDAVKNTKKALPENISADSIEKVVKSFTNKRMGSRVLTNMGIFATVAAFYTQIPKLYNLGTNGENPALKGTAAAKKANDNNTPSAQVVTDTNVSKTEKAENKVEGKEVPFTGMASFLEKTGEKVFNGKNSKAVSDIFELNGPIISGKAMPVLLYGFCIPPRLQHASDKYEYGEVIVRDITAFTALLFGAKALARLFSDGFTKLTGLALNRKDMEGRNILQKVMDYLNPSDTRHSVLSSKQLESKYTNINKYKGGVNGFIEFIENSDGNIKKVFTHDKKIQAAVDAIVNKFGNKSFADASVVDIKNALKAAHTENGDLIKNFYKLFDSNNGLLKHAKTYNSTFGFLSTLVFVPGLIIWLTNVCERMTARRTQQDFAKQAAQEAKNTQIQTQTPQTADAKIPAELNRLRTDNLSMAGFMKK